jgi:hypothetical protein
MLIDEFLCKREVLGKRAPHSFTPPPPPSKCGRCVQQLIVLIVNRCMPFDVINSVSCKCGENCINVNASETFREKGALSPLPGCQLPMAIVISRFLLIE